MSYSDFIKGFSAQFCISSSPGFFIPAYLLDNAGAGGIVCSWQISIQCVVDGGHMDHKGLLTEISWFSAHKLLIYGSGCLCVNDSHHDKKMLCHIFSKFY